MLATIYVNGKRKVIGEIVDGVFHKKVRKSEHLFKRDSSWGIDGKYFKYSIYPNKYKIHIYDEETNIHYVTDCETIEKYGEWRHYKPYRAQIFLPLVYWEIK